MHHNPSIYTHTHEERSKRLKYRNTCLLKVVVIAVIYEYLCEKCFYFFCRLRDDRVYKL